MWIARSLASLVLAMLALTPAAAQRVSFTAGIGYYVFYDGLAYPLSWTESISEKFNDKSVLRIPKHAEFYVFGLDFSSAGLSPAPVPPHLVEIGMSYLTKDGKIVGRYRASFLPVPGYPEKVYRIAMPTYVVDQKNYEYFALSVQQGGNYGRGYLFRFSDDEPQVKELADALTGKLASGAALAGEVIDYQDPSRSSKVVLQIDGFELKPGTFNAKLKLEAEGKQIAYKGRKLSERELVLRRVDNDESKVHLFLRGDKTLVGSWQSGFFGTSIAGITIRLDPAAAK